MEIREAKHLTSSPGLKECPKPILPEHAFIGRSNVGKSSLINMLTGKKGLAKTSSTPGKTRLINHFSIDDSWYLADLPGYGYARVSKTVREAWPAMIRNYLEKRINLLNSFILIDVRLEPQAIDLAFIRWMGEKQLPFTIVFTKCDKLSDSKVHAAVRHYGATLMQEWEELPQMFVSSASTGKGRDELLRFILEANNVFRVQ
ncbi:MAG: ribosome biogenesis GTP-binding protein YihA/YsxC [Bacteroidales bacterium]